MVTITAGVGFAMAAVSRAWQPTDLIVAAIGCLTGTALSAAGANALNMWMERRRDSLMHRTASRPLPSGRLTARAALLTGVSLCIVGIGALWAACGPCPAAISAATIITYLSLYTPSKPLTPLSTLIGAVPGALPPLIGWAAGSSQGWAALIEPGGWSLFLIMFVWQVPHFLAIAWLYRDDYARGGHRVMPVLDPTGRHTAATILIWTACLIPVLLWPVVAMPHVAGPVYGVTALVGGLAFLVYAVRFARTRARTDAKAAFLASVVMLPLVLISMVAESLVRAWLG